MSRRRCNGTACAAGLRVERASTRGCSGTRARRFAALGCIALGGLAATGEALAQVQFPVSFEASAVGVTASERAQLASHVAAAGQLWVRELAIEGPRSIEVAIGIDDTRQTANGGSVTSVFVGVAGGRDLFEQGAAAELRSGADPNGAAADIRITLNTTYLRNELWFDPAPALRTATVPPDRTDAMSVLLHEFGHALAYNGFANPANGVPQPTFWSTFDRWMIPGPPTPVRFAGPRASAAHGSNPDLTINNIFHWGNTALQGLRPAQAPATTAPIRFVDGRPQPPAFEHEPVSIDASALAASMLRADALADELMNGLFFVRGTRYAISNLDRATLADAGLPMALFRDGFE